MKDYYKMLELPFNAPLNDIKKAYRNLAFKYHPDRSKTTESAGKFIVITEAYEVLKDPAKRKDYDLLYNKFIKQNLSVSLEYTEQESTWKSYGEKKAKEYASMSYDLFIKRAIDELIIAKKYTVNFVLLVFCVFAVISTPVFFSIDPIFGIFCCFFYGILGLLLYKRTVKNYKSDRNKKFNI